MVLDRTEYLSKPISTIKFSIKHSSYWMGSSRAVLYWVLSEGSRVVFPPRNLIPVP